MRNYRSRQKLKTPTTKEKKRLRKKWRLAKRLQRSNLTPTQKDLSVKRSLVRKLNALDPEQFEHIMMNTTPRKLQHLQQKGLLNSPKSAKRLRVRRSLADVLTTGVRDLQKMKKPEYKAKRKYLVSLAKSTIDCRARAQMNMSLRTFKKYSMISEEASLVELQARKQRSDTLKPDLKDAVLNFFSSRSRQIPMKRLANKAVLTDTTRSLHKQFKSDNEDLKISLSAFKKLRPKHMLTVDRMKFVGCVCEYCINVDYEVRSPPPSK